MIRPLLSRAQVYTLRPLDAGEMQVLLDRTVATDEVLGRMDVRIEGTDAMLRESALQRSSTSRTSFTPACTADSV